MTIDTLVVMGLQVVVGTSLWFMPLHDLARCDTQRKWLCIIVSFVAGIWMVGGVLYANHILYYPIDVLAHQHGAWVVVVQMALLVMWVCPLVAIVRLRSIRNRSNGR